MPLRTAIALVGYATLDYIARAEGALQPAGTNPIRIADEGWPRIGGAPVYAGEALLQAGHAAALIASIGADAPGAALIVHLRQRGFATQGLEQSANGRTPVCVLIHQPDGRYCCFLDRGGAPETGLSPAQKAVLQAADWVLIAAGQSGMAQEALSLMRADQQLAWIVKADATSFPKALRDALRRRAAVIFLNRHEADFLGAQPENLPPHQLVFETDGERGVHIHRDERIVTLTTAMLDTMDTTGAGDTFAGATLAALIARPEAVEDAARAGLAAATRLLSQRQS